MGIVRWLLGDTRECVAGQYIGDRAPFGQRGMFVDPAQIPLTLMEPSMQPGQSAAPETPLVRVECDPSVNACYAYLFPGRAVARTIEVADTIMVDVDADGCPVGVETLDGSDWTGALVSLAMRGRLRIT